MTIRCIKFTALEKGALRGFCDLALDSGLVIHDALLMESGERRWVNLPGKPQIDKDRNLIRGEGGKIVYSPVLSIGDRTRRDAFNAQALRAIDEFRSGQPRQPRPTASAATLDDPLPF